MSLVGKYEAAPLAQVYQLLHRDRAFGRGLRLRSIFDGQKIPPGS